MELAKLDGYVRMQSLGLSRVWVKVTLQLVNDPRENISRLDVVPLFGSAPPRSIPLNDDRLKLSSAFDQRSQSLAETLIQFSKHGTMHFCRLVRLKGFTETGEPMQYMGRLNAMRADVPQNKRIPFIGPSIGQDVERCVTVLKFGVRACDSAQLDVFAKTLNFHLGTSNEEWKPRSLSTVSSTGSLNMRTADEAMYLSAYQLDELEQQNEHVDRPISAFARVHVRS